MIIYIWILYNIWVAVSTGPKNFKEPGAKAAIFNVVAAEVAAAAWRRQKYEVDDRKKRDMIE